MDIINELKEKKFTKKEMCGLSNAEKEFIRENNYHIQLEQKYTIATNGTLYMFIARDNLGRKKLYAITKHQSIYPNGNDFGNSHNYAYWLLFNSKSKEFSIFNYEFRHASIPNLRLIYP